MISCICILLCAGSIGTPTGCDPSVMGGVTYHSMLTRDGRRLVSRRGADGNPVYELVPTNALPKDAPAMREWKLYVVKATHTDIGLHNPQYVQRHGAVKRIEDAMRLIDADRRGDDDPAAYRYVMEGVWFWENYPADRGEAAAWNVISNYVRRGRMDIACECAGNHTHVMGPEELRRSALTKKRLAARWGVPTATMIMADNPGLSWSIVKPYAEAGVRNVIFAPNQWNPLPSTLHRMNRAIPSSTWNPDAGGGGNYVDVSYDSERPMVFRWESYDRSTNLLVWCSTQYDHGLSRLGFNCGSADLAVVEKKMPGFLGILERKYPYDLWLACEYGDDEPANTRLADIVAEWNRKWAFPQFRTVGHLDEPFDELRRRFGDRIPTVRGEMTSGWLQHVVSAPELLAEKLEAERGLVRLGNAGIDVDRAWWELVMNDEHSYGTSGYQGRRVFETWMQHRDWIRDALHCTVGALADRHGNGGSADQPVCQRQSAGRRRYGAGEEVPPGGVGENAWYRVRVNERGEITSVFDKELGRELLDGVANRFLYTRDNHKSWADEALLGAKITRRVFLAKDAKRIDVEDVFEHCEDLFNTRRYHRYGYLAFPFAVPDGKFRAQLGGGEVIDPYLDQSGYATDAYVAVRDWCAVENGDFGVALMQRDSTLTEFGEIHPDKTCFTGRAPEGKSAIYSYLFTDWLQLHVPDGEKLDYRFRYSITSYRAGEKGAPVPWRVEAPAGAPLTAANFPEQNGQWTGLLREPVAGHGEKDGQLYLLWGAELDPGFDHYELRRDDGFTVCVTNEAPDGIAYRVARYVDLDAGSHTTRTYRVRKVWKDGRRDAFSAPFAGRTRKVFDVEAIESEGLRAEFRRIGGTVTAWQPEGIPENVLGKGGVHLTLPGYEKTRWKLEERIGKSIFRWSTAAPDAGKLLLEVMAGGEWLRLELKKFDRRGGQVPCDVEFAADLNSRFHLNAERSRGDEQSRVLKLTVTGK